MNSALKKNRGTKQKGKDQRSLQENWKYQRNISPKDGCNKGQKMAETQQIQKRSRRDEKNTWNNCTKKDLNELENCNGVVCHPEPDILDCEVKWALGSTAVDKTSGCNFSRAIQNPKE